MEKNGAKIILGQGHTGKWGIFGGITYSHRASLKGNSKLKKLGKCPIESVEWESFGL